MAGSRILVLILSTIVFSSIGWSSHASGPRSVAPATVTADGRLGGSRASFDAAYADQQPEVTGSGTLFSSDDLGLFLVNFQGRTITPDPADRAAVIVISAPRDPGAAAETAEPADWTTEEAMTTAGRFLPDDASIEIDEGTGSDQPEQPTCQSDLLSALDLGGGAGSIGCQIAVIQPTPETVSFITLSLTDPEIPAAHQDPCAGIAAWATATGEHMTDAEALIASIEELDLSADDAATELGDIADGLDVIADAQRELDAPPPAVRAQTSLLTALDGYVEALDLAASAITSADDTVLEQSIALATAARNDYATADDRVLLALRACSLASGSVQENPAIVS